MHLHVKVTRDLVMNICWFKLTRTTHGLSLGNVASCMKLYTMFMFLLVAAISRHTANVQLQVQVQVSQLILESRPLFPDSMNHSRLAFGSRHITVQRG